ncbi:hypothetical protein CLPUN_33770 [Clostridium puniceum]|uniref:Uncharacterized protein n=1 Tax=Clostridium puniceum TaxID=29367 RepID=A0A1S8TBR5_9CLOT|nr:hypothetical protein [Clostridium puniceum]OOM75247.1 hypothetical protein CLPUN_33770 [Clostridium puniceum]
MKKSTTVVVLGFFVVITALLGMNGEKLYQKQKLFETVDEVLHQLDNKPLKEVNEKGIFTESNDLKECFSERKRLTDSRFDYGKIGIAKLGELNDNDKQEILEEYNAFRNQFSKRREITKEEPVRIYIEAWYSHLDNGKRVYVNPRKIKIDLVFIDEGEGLVIDYIMEKNDEKLNDEEGNKDA